VAQQTRDNMAVIFPHIQRTIATDFMQDLYMPWIINKPKGWYVSNLHQIFLTSRLKKKFLPLKVFGLLNHALHMRFIFFILSNSYLQSLCCLSTSLGAQCLVIYLWKSIKEFADKPPILYLQLDNCTKDNKN
jgi:hypothetical protein